MLWNEPNNRSHWDFDLDPEWRQFAAMVRPAARLLKRVAPGVRVVLGGISPIDPLFVRRLANFRLLDEVDVLGVHGFPLDWNHWMIDEWPQQLQALAAETCLPLWVTEAGASSFGAEEVQVFGLERSVALLRGRVERVHWYSLFDLPPNWPATTRHREAEGSAYYRHYHMGLLRSDGTPKAAVAHFPPGLGICQWFHFEDPRLEQAVEWLHRLGVRYLRTGLSWADWFRPGAEAWFDRQMAALAQFDMTLTLCFTPEHLGLAPHHSSPPLRPEDFTAFVAWIADRYLGAGSRSTLPSVAQPASCGVGEAA